MATLPGSSVTRELELFVRSGLTSFEALRSAIAHPAQVLILGEEIGHIRVGYTADIILVNGNPLADISVVEHPVGAILWQESGTLFDLTTGVLYFKISLVFND